jgi:hypothetical protein
LNNLAAEQSVGANDTRHRFEIAIVYDLPIGHGRSIGKRMNRVLDGIVGGWSLNTLLKLQTGLPVPFAMASPRLTDGNQRPNIVCNPASGMSVHDVAMSTDPNASYYNASCLADPGDQVAGNAPRFSTDVRGQGVHNIDLGIFKSFRVREGMKAEVRGEFLNATNTPRFLTPSSFYGDSGFGQVTAQSNDPRHIQMGVRFEF